MKSIYNRLSRIIKFFVTVKIFVKDGQYIIQPTINGEELYSKTGYVGSISYKIMAMY
jgi:hypothetical protein